jgi:Arc/MetJ-type ribon-helix-helix transcriptional regulator
MAQVPSPPTHPISVRLDATALAALEQLTEQGKTRSEAIREALIARAERRHERASLAAEARRLADDPEDRTAKAEITTFMDSLRAPW